MQYGELIRLVADLLKEFDSTKPVHKSFRPGIGPFGEPQIVAQIAKRLVDNGVGAKTKRTPDLAVNLDWAIEFKIVRPFGDNGKEAENWSVNLLHPYAGNVSLIGDALKLSKLTEYNRRGLFLICYEHKPPKIDLEPLLASFELIARQIAHIQLSSRH